MAHGVSEMASARSESEEAHEDGAGSFRRPRRRLFRKAATDEPPQHSEDWTGYYVASHDWPAFENDIPMEQVYRIIDGFEEYLPLAQQSLAVGDPEGDDGDNPTAD